MESISNSKKRKKLNLNQRSRNSSRQEKENRHSSVVHAAAFQQHYSKKLRIREPQKSRKLTIEQKLGIAEKPPPKPTEEEWKEKINTALEREVPIQRCSICQDFLALKKQLILSCGHVFHQQCVLSFEKYADLPEPQCPLCRQKHYWKHVFNEGKQRWMIYCICRIQALFKGYKARKKFFWMKLNRDPEAKRKYLINRVSNLTKKVEKSVQNDTRYIDILFERIDRDFKNKSEINYAFGDEWIPIIRQASQRNESDCPICLEEMKPFVRQTNSEIQIYKECVILSCSHVLHQSCLVSLENFSKAHNCPICRQNYGSKIETSAISSELKSEYGSGSEF